MYHKNMTNVVLFGVYMKYLKRLLKSTLNRMILVTTLLTMPLQIEASSSSSSNQATQKKPNACFSRSYYTGKNLKQLGLNNERKHAPLAILVDNSEKAFRDSLRDNLCPAITHTLSGILQNAFVPTLVSKGLLENYIARRHCNENDGYFNKQNNPVDFKQWKGFIIPNSLMILLIPDFFYKHYEVKNIFSSLQNWQPFPIEEIDKNHTHALKILNEITSTKQYHKAHCLDEEVLSLVFTSKTNKNKTTNVKLPVWDIHLTGHGTDRYIADIPVREIGKILSFFNNSICTGCLYILTCQVGGSNLNFLEYESKNKEKKNRLRKLNYSIIVSGVTDKPALIVGGIEKTPTILSKFWDNAAQLEKKKKICDLLKNLNPAYLSEPGPKLHRTTSNAPQIFLPGTNGFQFIATNNKIGVLKQEGIVNPQSTRQSTPINFPSTTRAILSYMPSITKPINATPYEIYSKSDNAFIKKWQQVEYYRKQTTQCIATPNLSEVLTNYWHSINALVTKGKYPALKYILTELGSNNEQQSTQKVAIELAHVYPEFINMMRSSNTQHISKIKLSKHANQSNILTGVLHFIRDSFLVYENIQKTQHVIIDKLSGKNDFSPLLEAAQHAALHPLELELPISEHSDMSQDIAPLFRDMIGKNITLYNIIINASPRPLQSPLKFIYKHGENSSAWELTWCYDPIKWRFKQISIANHIKDYNKYMNKALVAAFTYNNLQNHFKKIQIQWLKSMLIPLQPNRPKQKHICAQPQTPKIPILKAAKDFDKAIREIFFSYNTEEFQKILKENSDPWNQAIAHCYLAKAYSFGYGTIQNSQKAKEHSQQFQKLYKTHTKISKSPWFQKEHKEWQQN